MPVARRRWEAPLVFLALTALYLASAQEDFWGDGKFLQLWTENGRWDFYHLAYLPLAQVFRATLGSLFGWDVQETLTRLSIVLGASSGAVLYAAARAAGAGPPAALGATVLYALSPVVWFFSGCIEVHPVQMLASALVCLWAARASRAGTFGGDPLVVGALFAGVTAGHLSGVTWAPAAAQALRAGPRARPGRWIAAVALLALVACLWLLVDRSGGRGEYHLELGARSLLRPPALALGLRELLLPAGILYPLACAALVHALVGGFLPRASPALWPTLVLFACTAPLAFLIDIAERGAYFVSLLPVLCTWLALWMQRLPGRVLVPLALLGIGAQGWLGWRGIQSWDELAPADAWIRTLESEAGPKTIVFTADARLVAPIQHHTPMIVFAALPAEGLGLEQPEIRARGVEIASKKSAEGYRIAISGEIAGSDDPDARAFVAALAAALGEPRPGADPRYALFPARER